MKDVQCCHGGKVARLPPWILNTLNFENLNPTNLNPYGLNNLKMKTLNPKDPKPDKNLTLKTLETLKS